MNCPVCLKPMNGEVCEHCLFTLRPIGPKLNIKKSRQIKSLDPNTLSGVDLLYYHLSENALEREGENRTDSLFRKKTEQYLKDLYSDEIYASSTGDTTLIIDKLTKIEKDCLIQTEVTETIDMGDLEENSTRSDSNKNDDEYEDYQASVLIDAILDRNKTNNSNSDYERISQSETLIEFPDLGSENGFDKNLNRDQNPNNSYKDYEYEEPDPIYEPDFPLLSEQSTEKSDNILTSNTIEEESSLKINFTIFDQVYKSEIESKYAKKELKKLVKNAEKNPADTGKDITEFLSGSVIVEGKSDNEAKKKKHLFGHKDIDGIESVPDLFFDNYFREFEKPKEDTAREEKRKRNVFVLTAGGLIMAIFLLIAIIQIKNFM